MREDEWNREWKKALARTPYNIDDNETSALYMAIVKHFDILTLNYIVKNRHDRGWNKDFYAAAVNEITERTLLNK